MFFFNTDYWMLICFRKPIQQGDWRVWVWLWRGSGRHPGEWRGQRDQTLGDASVRDQPPDPPGQWGWHHQVSEDCKIMACCRQDLWHGKYTRWKLLTPSHKTKWPTGFQMLLHHCKTVSVTKNVQDHLKSISMISLYLQAALFCQQTWGVRDALEEGGEHHHRGWPDRGQGGEARGRREREQPGDRARIAWRRAAVHVSDLQLQTLGDCPQRQSQRWVFRELSWLISKQHS